MARFLIRRILQGALVLLLMTFTVYAIFFLGPGPQFVARVMAGKSATPAEVNAIANQFYLNKPWYVAYGHFLGGLLHGNLGYDYYNNVPVTTSIKQAFPITLSLVIGAAILWLLYGVATGIISAVRTRSLMDRFFTTQALFFYSMPTFVLGLLLILLLYQILTTHGVAIFPAPGSYTSFTTNPAAWAHDLILPWVTLALVSAATYTRLTRGSMLDVFGEDYIRTARSKGMSERRVILRHNLRASLTPVVTQFGLDVGTLIGGAIITEQVFSLPGLGWTAVHAIQSQDLPLIMGIVIVASTGVIVANLIVDIFYAVLDPRVRLH
ncbi:MAG TPA: ABC transporter permease [Streptosporangiaceae bacterium]|nr:ABC transporter permease [Streptosporangiaceae bacterium]